MLFYEISLNNEHSEERYYKIVVDANASRLYSQNDGDRRFREKKNNLFRTILNKKERRCIRITARLIGVFE